MTKQQLLDSLAEMLKAAPSATVAIPGFSGQPATRPAVKANGEETAKIVESTPFRRVLAAFMPSTFGSTSTGGARSGFASVRRVSRGPIGLLVSFRLGAQSAR